MACIKTQCHTWGKFLQEKNGKPQSNDIKVVVLFLIRLSINMFVYNCKLIILHLAYLSPYSSLSLSVSLTISLSLYIYINIYYVYL